MYFWNSLLPKRWLDKGLKSAVSEDPLRGNMVNWPKHCCNLDDSTFYHIYWSLLITVKVIELEKVSFSAMENPKTVC